jgi:hypothetical protein
VGHTDEIGEKQKKEEIAIDSFGSECKLPHSEISNVSNGRKMRPNVLMI